MHFSMLKIDENRLIMIDEEIMLVVISMKICVPVSR